MDMEWVCPKCDVGYSMPEELIQREKRYHRHEDEP